MKEHKRHVSKVFQRLLENHLYVEPEKCEIHVVQTQFLRFIVSPGHMEMDPKKIEAVLNWPIPTTVKEGQWFMSFANFYRKCIKKFQLC